MRMPLSSEREQDFQHQQALLIRENDSKSILVTLPSNIILMICIRVAFILIKHWKNIGHIGVDIFISTAT